MPQPWDPEHGVDADLASRLVAAAWPDLAREPPERVGSGWDVDVWRFGAIAVRFPRRALAIPCLEKELEVLPVIADRVPLPVPRPLAIGDPAFGFPSRFYAHAFLSGAPAIRAGLDDGQLARLAGPLGRFLRALHAIEIPGLRRDPRTLARSLELARGRLDVVPSPLRDRVEALLILPPDASVHTLVHGDVHAGNLLVDDDGAPTAVIDWGDAAIGDPAIDLAIGWSAIPAGGRGDFLAAYGDVSPDVWTRARFAALTRHAIALFAWGRDTGDARVEAFARASIERCVS